jgi:hypothetical protein
MLLRAFVGTKCGVHLGWRLFVPEEGVWRGNAQVIR